MLNLHACLCSFNTSTFISVTDPQNSSDPINPRFLLQEPKKKGKKKGKAFFPLVFSCSQWAMLFYQNAAFHGGTQAVESAPVAAPVAVPEAPAAAPVP